MQFYFIRHAESTNNYNRRLTGSSTGRSDDPELTDMGRQQAELLAQFLRGDSSSTGSMIRDFQNLSGFGITHLYSSLMIRSIDTGTAIAKALNLPLVAWEDIHECRGIYLRDEQTNEPIGREGKNRAFFEVNYPHFILPDSLGEKGWWNRPAELTEEWFIRAKRFWQVLLQKHGDTDDRVAIVSHGGFYRSLLTVILHLPEGGSYSFVINNTAISRLDVQEDKIIICYLNRVDFLPKNMIT